MRALTWKDWLAALLVVSSLILASLAAGLDSPDLWWLAGALFVAGDVLYLIGGHRADR